ncbi:MAG: TonB family protein [Bacteroidales bacterium]|nr:TonB family protein [Bacteroidales bacterium]
MMKRKCFLAALMLLILGVSAQAQYKVHFSDIDDSETVASLKEHVAYISSPSKRGRAAGSDGEYETAIYVADMFKKYGVEMLSPDEGDLFGIKQTSGDTLTSRNVVGFIQGYDKSLRDEYIVIGARMDNIGVRSVTIDGVPTEKMYYGANGNASGLALMMELARMLQTNSLLLKRSVIFVAFGSSLEGNAGSWYFLNRSFGAAEKIAAMINLDIVGIPKSQEFLAFTSSNSDMNAVVNSLANTLQPVHPTITSLEPFPSDHRSFYAMQIPSVMFSTGHYSEYGSDRDTYDKLEYDFMERELEYLFNFSVKLVNGERPLFNPNERKTPVADGSDVVPYYDCDYKPSFLGRVDPTYFLQKWVYQYLRYPQKAVVNGIQGRVLVDFIINEKGKVTDVKVLKGVDEMLDEEAVRVIKASPNWKPGRVKGKPVKAELSLYVEFRLEKKKK